MSIELYFILALATGITGVIMLFHPVLEELAIRQPDNVLVEYKYLTYLTYLCILVIIAPLVLAAVLIPSQSTIFRKALLNAMLAG